MKSIWFNVNGRDCQIADYGTEQICGSVWPIENDPALEYPVMVEIGMCSVESMKKTVTEYAKKIDSKKNQFF